jgi:uncharacterized protein
MTAPSNAPLSVLLISDGRPGHYNLAEGIVAALERLRPVRMERLEARRPAWVPARVLSSLLNGGMAPARILRSVYRVEPELLGRPEVIVSAGGDTLAANVAAARITGAPNIFYGSLRRYRPEDFALVMTSYAADAIAPNRLMWLKPSKLDPDALAAEMQADRRSPSAPLGLIVGGDSGTIEYQERDWDELLAFVGETSQRLGLKWIVANSPRTPKRISDRLETLAEADKTAIAQFIDVRSAGPGTLAPVLVKSRAIVCTADSSTMLSEAVWMRQQVVAVAPRAYRLPNNELSYRAWLEGNHWLRQLPISELEDPGAIAHALQYIEPQEGNPLDQLAAELQVRLPGVLSG